MKNQFPRTIHTVDSSLKPNMVIVTNGIFEIAVDKNRLVATQVNEKPLDHDSWVEIVGPDRFYALYGVDWHNLTVEAIK